MDSAVLQRWRLGAELGARGLYGQAETIAAELLADPRAEVQALGAALAASHRRQLGDHECARVHDDQGIETWESSDLEADWPYIDLIIGRAADAIGLGELAAARAWLATAEALADFGDTRTSVRHGWVSAELALASDDPAEALRLIGELELPLARLRSPRHAVKSRLVGAVALDALDRADEARAELDRVLLDATQGMWHSLVWPAALVRGRLAQDDEERRDFYRIAQAMVEMILMDLHPSRAAAFIKTLPDEITPAA